MPTSPAFSTRVGGHARVGKVINVGQVHAEKVVFGVEASTAGTFRLLGPPEPFVDRQAERTALAARLRCGGAHLLCGLGGVGKSALALRVAHDLAAQGAFPDGVFWVPLESAPAPEMAAAWLVTALGVPGEADPLGTVAGLLYDRRALLVLDNAEAAPEAADALLACRGRGCAVLVTSRDVRVGVGAIPGVPDDLAPLEPADAADLLRAHLGEVPIAGDWAAAICDLVGGLPLALVLAAAFIARELRGSPDPAAEYLDLLRDTPLAALEMGDRRDTSVRVTFDLSWGCLDAAARRALAVLAHAPGDSVSAAAVAAGIEDAPARARAALRALTRFSLVAREGDRYRAHPLVRHYACERAVAGRASAEVAAATRLRLRRHYLDYVQAHEEDWPALEQERDNVLGAMAWAWQEEDWAQVTAYAGAVLWHLRLRGYPRLARERAGWWLQAAGHLGERGEAARAVQSLGDVHRMLAEYELARGRYEEALPIYRAIGARLGEANAVQSLGDVALATECLDDAQSLYRQAMEIHCSIGDRYGVAHTSAMLGRLAAARGQEGDARDLLQEAARTFAALGAKGAAATVRSWLKSLPS